MTDADPLKPKNVVLRASQFEALNDLCYAMRKGHGMIVSESQIVRAALSAFFSLPEAKQKALIEREKE